VREKEWENGDAPTRLSGYATDVCRVLRDKSFAVVGPRT